MISDSLQPESEGLEIKITNVCTLSAPGCTYQLQEGAGHPGYQASQDGVWVHPDMGTDR